MTLTYSKKPNGTFSVFEDGMTIGELFLFTDGNWCFTPFCGILDSDLLDALSEKLREMNTP